MMSLLAFVVLVGVLITVHEFGHYVAAKLSGVKVVRFSVGFGRTLVGFTRGETEYRIAVLPLGGAVQLYGMDPDDAEAGPQRPEDVGRGIFDKPPFIRLLIFAAGPAMNLILPFFILLPYVAIADPFKQVTSNVIGALDREMPAWQAGLREGDQVIDIDGEPISAFWQISRVIEGYDPAQGSLAVTVARPDAPAPLRFELVPIRVTQTHSLLGFSKDYYRIGYQPLFQAPDVAVLDPRGAMAQAGVRTFDRVVAVDDTPIRHFPQLRRHLESLDAGTTATLTVERDAPLDSKLPFLSRITHHTLSFTARGRGPEAAALGIQHAGACVASVGPGTPTDGVLQVGDCVIEANGHAHSLADFVGNELRNAPEHPKALRVLRASAAGPVEHALTIAPEKLVHTDPMAGELVQWRLGFMLHGLSRPGTLVPSDPVANTERLAHAWYTSRERVFRELEMTLSSIFGMFTGRVSPTQLSGPVTIFKLAGDAAKAGLERFLSLMVLLSLSIALINLLPVPALDGGQMLVASVEMVMRRPLPLRVRNGLQMVGVVLIVALVLFALGNDLVRMWRLQAAG